MATQYKAKLNPFNGILQLVPTNVVLSFKAAVATYTSLPLTGNAMGDARISNDTGHLWVWSIESATGLLTDWSDSGDITDIDWSVITNKPSSSVSNIDDAVDKKHSQGLDQGLDTGGANAVTAAQAKAGYTHSGVIIGNPHAVTKSDVGLGNVDDKSEATIITDVKADSDVADALSKKHTTHSDDVVISKIIYIDKSGNDSTGNGTLEKPYLKINAAYTYAKTLTPSISNIIKIKIGIGTFDEQIIIDTDYVLFEGVDRELSEISYSGAGHTIYYTDMTIKYVEWSHLKLSNTNATWTWYVIAHEVWASIINLRIRDCYFPRIASGTQKCFISWSSHTMAYIDDCLFGDIYGAGVDNWFKVWNVTMTNTILIGLESIYIDEGLILGSYLNAWHGVNITGSPKFVGCIIDDYVTWNTDGGESISTSTTGEAEFIGCLIKTDKNGIRIQESSKPRYVNCEIYNNRTVAAGRLKEPVVIYSATAEPTFDNVTFNYKSGDNTYVIDATVGSCKVNLRGCNLPYPVNETNITVTILPSVDIKVKNIIDSDTSNSIDVGDVKDAVDKKHARNEDTQLLTYESSPATVLATDIRDAITDSHTHSNKTEIDKVTDGDHDVRTDNPHSVTKTQVGLTNVTDDAQVKASQLKRATFVNGDLSTGKLTITHNLALSAPYSVIVVIFDNNNKQIIPDDITGANNSIEVDLTSFGAISGTWGYLLLG